MNGNLSMDKSYINNSKYRIKIPSVVDEYFSANNNLKLDYYKEFDFMKLIEPTSCIIPVNINRTYISNMNLL